MFNHHRYRPTGPRRFQGFVYTALGWIADKIDAVFVAPEQPRNDTLVSYYKNVDGCKTARTQYSSWPQTLESDDWDDQRIDDSGTGRVCDDTFIKASYSEDFPSSEQLASNLVSAQTTILTPYIRRVVRGRTRDYLVMPYIEGRRLSSCWASMSWFSKIRVAWTLRRYIHQLRRIRPPYPVAPGPVGPQPRTPQGLLFGETPRHSVFHFDDHAAFLNHMAVISEARFSRTGKDDPYVDSGPLVFTHHDLNMRNVIIGTDGRVWLIDFGWSGFYPPSFEQIAASMAAVGIDCAPWSWRILIPFITGPYFENERWAFNIGPF